MKEEFFFYVLRFDKRKRGVLKIGFTNDYKRRFNQLKQTDGIITEAHIYKCPSKDYAVKMESFNRNLLKEKEELRWIPLDRFSYRIENFPSIAICTPENNIAFII